MSQKAINPALKACVRRIVRRLEVQPEPKEPEPWDYTIYRYRVPPGTPPPTGNLRFLEEKP